MVRPFDDATRRNIAKLCAAFTRLPSDETAVLKRAAVVIALTRSEADAGTSFLLTRRAAGLRCETGRFQQMMQVELVNEGPVTILLDSGKAF